MAAHNTNRTQVDTKKNPKTSRTRPISSFDEFWSLYPRKVGKRSALKSYTSALKRATGPEIIAGIHRAVPDWLTHDAQFIPHPSTWLNRDGWCDESQIELERARSSAAARQARKVMGLPDDPYALAVGDGK